VEAAVAQGASKLWNLYAVPRLPDTSDDKVKALEKLKQWKQAAQKRR
jgi:hypothetical protein